MYMYICRPGSVKNDCILASGNLMNLCIIIIMLPETNTCTCSENVTSEEISGCG